MKRILNLESEIVVSSLAAKILIFPKIIFKMYSSNMQNINMQKINILMQILYLLWYMWIFGEKVSQKAQVIADFNI